MSVTIKTQHEIELMREAGHLLEKVHDGLILTSNRVSAPKRLIRSEKK